MANVKTITIAMLGATVLACGPSYQPQSSSEQSSQAPGTQQPQAQAPATPPPSNSGMLRMDVPPEYPVGPRNPSAPIATTPVPVQPAPVQPAPARPSVPAPVAADAQPVLPSRFQAILGRHNQHRANHCAAPLRWSTKLAARAQRWADQLKDAGCAFEHSPNNPYGENLFAFSPIGNMTPEQVTTGWYDEVKLYNFAQGGFSMSTGHFTQLVWRNTQSLGCGVSMCNGGEIWVCNYDPPGNVRGYYDREVLPSTCK